MAVRCHYEVLGVPLDADASTIKKAHRKLALKWHPDKNPNDEAAAEQFRLVQQAYECLSDPAERKWYNEHREAILRGWSSHNNNNDKNGLDILFDVVPFQHPSCFEGYGNDEPGFFGVYRMVFQKIYEGEEQGWVGEGNIEEMPLASFLVPDFGTSDTEWSRVSAFYQSWESFSSCLSYAWADEYDVRTDAETMGGGVNRRRVKRAMEDANKKARRAAKRERNEAILSLVRFVQRRDIRVKAHQQQVQRAQQQKAQEQAAEAKRKKEEKQLAREEWRKQAELEMAATEEQDRLAGRIRLADLEDDDDYDYGGGGKRKGRKKKKNRNKAKQTQPQEEVLDHQEEEEQVDTVTKQQDETDAEEWVDVAGEEQLDDVAETLVDESEDESEEEEEEEEEEPDSWRCVCCRKDFKSLGQMENHMKSKKHKEMYKKYQKKMAENG